MRWRFIYLLTISIFLLGICQTGRSQYSAEIIAARIAMDSNGVGTADDYMEYSKGLASLLSTYSPDALQRIMGVNYVKPPTLNDQLDLEPINFKGGSPEFAGDALKELDKVVEYLNENPSVKIEIGGHTSLDKVGFELLSENRAIAAKLYLAQKGIDPSRVTAVGYSHSQPIAEGYDNPENRRIEIIIDN